MLENTAAVGTAEVVYTEASSPFEASSLLLGYEVAPDVSGGASTRFSNWKSPSVVGTPLPVPDLWVCE